MRSCEIILSAVYLGHNYGFKVQPGPTYQKTTTRSPTDGEIWLYTVLQRNAREKGWQVGVGLRGFKIQDSGLHDPGKRKRPGKVVVI